MSIYKKLREATRKLKEENTTFDQAREDRVKKHMELYGVSREEAIKSIENENQQSDAMNAELDSTGATEEPEGDQS